MQVFYTVLLLLFAAHWGVLGTWKAEFPVFGMLFLKLGARAYMVFLRLPLWESFSSSRAGFCLSGYYSASTITKDHKAESSTIRLVLKLHYYYCC